MPQSYVLDTSIILNLIRGRELGESIDRAFGLRAAYYRHLVSIVSHGELRVLARRHEWQESKLAALAIALGEVVTVNIDNSAMIEAYVRVEESCSSAPGGEHNMGQNDMWIAATALHAGLPLITADKDFRFLDGRLIQVYWVDSGAGSQKGRSIN
ncbi:tRNA(fMet)-specific endonuclease VapC [Silvibacterium bohemicum]|uniref:tRNA(fMet)-specific endonuclease VapC n=1 Tax=Silvibacterium bohemicum TaxID=1577686 RepID=A0A841JRP4_9BACT|nr:type II toxin-antitoxin system VapC family toxin [Silvibacterium bohemicum]MBB6143986.1 tRNA(fMet)-specific endonuclease VapC [Silvibacterium bohemicum]